MRRLIAGVFALVLLTGCASAAVDPLPSAPDVPIPPTSSDVPNLSATAIDRVGGTTTTTAPEIRGGAATIRGRVLTSSGPAGGASIRIERLVGDRVASIDVTANNEGVYEVTNLLGGRYRVRAFRPPDATQTKAEVFFIGANDNKSLDLSLDRFSGGTDVRASVSPDPPILGQSASLTVAVSTRGVDSTGVARSIGAANVSVTVLSGGGRSVVSANPATTDGSGRARFTLVCNTLENQSLTFLLGDGSTYNINVAPCQLPPPTTTTTVPVAGQPDPNGNPVPGPGPTDTVVPAGVGNPDDEESPWSPPTPPLPPPAPYFNE